VQDYSLQQDAALQVRTALEAGRLTFFHLLVPEATQLLLIPSWLSCCCVILHILCCAAVPQAGALLTDTRQPPTSVSSKGSNAAADAGMPTCHAVSQGTMYHKHVHSYNFSCFSCLPHCLSLHWHACILCPDDISVSHQVICMGSVVQLEQSTAT